MNIDIEQIRRWADEIRSLTDDEETFLDTLEGQTDAIELLEKLLVDRAFAEAAEDASKAMADKFTARARRMADKQRHTTQMIGQILDAMGSQKVALSIATISRTKPRVSVEILDENEIPSQLMRIKKSPDAAAIKAQLEAGETVPGATLKTGQPGLTVRIK